MSSTSPSFKYEDAPDDPPSMVEPLVGSHSSLSPLHTLDDDHLELQPSPPQTPSNAIEVASAASSPRSASPLIIGEGSLSVDVQDAPVHPDEDGMESVATSPLGVIGLPIASPVAAHPPYPAMSHPLPTAPAAAPPPPIVTAAPAAAPAPVVATAVPVQPVAAAVPPPPVDPAVAERAAKRAAFFKGQAQRTQLLAASVPFLTLLPLPMPSIPLCQPSTPLTQLPVLCFSVSPSELESMTKQNEREESFWSSQEHRYTALLQRSEMADRTTRELVRFFQVSSRAVSRTLEELNVPLPLGSMETGSLKEACAATEQMRHIVVDNLSELRDKHLTHCLSHVSKGGTGGGEVMHCSSVGVGGGCGAKC